ncbi:MAG TPA: hypothetical protein VF945_14240 [Polyangia bacterium]
MRSIVLLLSAIWIAGCSGGTTGREPDEYTGCGSDETWRTFADQEPLATVSDAMAPLVTLPAAGATVPSSSPLVVKWQPDPNDVGAPDGNVPHDATSCPEYNIGAGLQTLHLPPISGDAYDLQFSVGGKVVWRVITTIQEWGATDATLAGWKGKTVSLKIWRMSVLRNDVKEGPFVGSAPFGFAVGP